MGIPVFTLGDKVSPVKIAEEGIKYANQKGYDMVFIDTAGRLHVDEVLMKELQDIKKVTQPTEILLVIDAMLGLMHIPEQDFLILSMEVRMIILFIISTGWI